MWKDDFDTAGSRRSPNRDHQDPDLSGLWTVCLAVALAAFFASALPAPLFAPAMRELLVLSAMGPLLVAVLRRDRIFARAFTAWDQAALLLFLGLLCGLFVDEQAVSQVLNQMIGEAGGAPA